MHTRKPTIKRSIIYTTILFITAISSLVILYTITQKIIIGDFGNALIGAILGAIVITFITLFQLERQAHKQSELQAELLNKEIENEKKSKVFEEKLVIYKEFFNAAGRNIR